MKTFYPKYFIEREKSSDLYFHLFLFSQLNICCGGANIVIFQVIKGVEREGAPLHLSPSTFYCGTVSLTLSAFSFHFGSQAVLKGYLYRALLYF